MSSSARPEAFYDVDHQRAVERRGDLQRRGPPAARRACPHRTVNRVPRARQRPLQRTVAIRQHGIDAFVGEHAGPVPSAAPAPRPSCRGRPFPRPSGGRAAVRVAAGRRHRYDRGTQGDELAVAVAGRAVGADTESLQDPQHRQTHRPESRLCDIGPGERGLLLGAGSLVKDRMREDAIAQTLRSSGYRRPRPPGRWPRAPPGKMHVSSRPLPTYWLAWPGNRNAISRADAGRRRTRSAGSTTPRPALAPSPRSRLRKAWPGPDRIRRREQGGTRDRPRTRAGIAGHGTPSRRAWVPHR